MDRLEFKKLKDQVEHLPRINVTRMKTLENNSLTPEDIYTPVVQDQQLQNLGTLEREEHKKKRFLFGWINSSDKLELCPLNIPRILIVSLVIYFLIYLAALILQIVILLAVDQTSFNTWVPGVVLASVHALFIIVIMLIQMKKSLPTLLIILNVIDVLVVILFLGWGAGYFGIGFLSLSYIILLDVVLLVIWVSS